MAVGTRFAGERRYRPPFARRIGIQLFARVVSLIVRQRVTDTTSGFRAVNRSGIVLFASDYPHDYPEVETTVLVHRHRLRMVEVPVAMRTRATGPFVDHPLPVRSTTCSRSRSRSSSGSSDARRQQLEDR